MKKLTSLLLILALLIGIPVTAAAAIPANAAIMGVVYPISHHYNPDLEEIKLSDLGSDRALEFPLTADMFEWSSSGFDTVGEAVTSSHISRSRIRLHSVNQTSATSSLIESANIVYKRTSASGNKPTAVVQVKFRNIIITTKRPFDTTLYLSIDGVRSDTSSYRLSGNLVPGGSTTDIWDGDYVDISKGIILEPSQSVKNVELYLGADVSMKVNLSARQRYYGVASKTEINAADENLLRKYSSLEEIITIRQSGLNRSGNYVRIESGDNYYVYNSDRQYIGRTNLTLPFSTKYYLSRTNINMGGDTSTVSQEDQPPTSAPTPAPSAGGAIGRDDALAKTRAALATSKSATVRYKDMSSITSATLQAMNNAARNSGGSVSLIADTMNGKTVQGRLTIPAANAARLGSDISLGVYTDSAHTSAVKSIFDKWYSNRVAVISLAQKGSYGMYVSIAAKVNLTSFNTSTLYLYSYDKSINQYRQMTDTGAFIDKNGYLHFTAFLAGEIIVTDSPLKRK